MGNQRIQAMELRLAEMRDAARAPDRCGPEIPVAPARGPCAAFSPVRVEQTPAGPRVRRDGWSGRDAVRVLDAFDLAQAQSDRARSAGRVALFTPSQIAVGRLLHDLVQRCAAAGYSLSSFEGRSGGGASGGAGFSEALRDDLARLDRLMKAIPRTPALRGRGEDGRIVRHDRLVMMFCVGGKTLAQVLAAHGWHGKSAPARGKLLDALRGALDDMALADRGAVRKKRS